MNGQRLDKLALIFYAGALAMFGQLATLLYKALKGEQFKVFNWLMSLMLAFIIGWIVKDFIPSDSSTHDAMLIISGLIANPLFGIIEQFGILAAKTLGERVTGQKLEKKDETTPPKA